MRYKPFTHHRRSIRLPGYDYSQAGAYFVTVCTQYRECLFGEIANGQMRLNEFGEIILKWWDALPGYYRYANLDEFVVMPNHVHGIIVLTCGEATSSSQEKAPDLSIDKRTLGQLVGYFKFNCSKEINQCRDTEYARVLQRGYYEHIIRNDREWNTIVQYIRENPARWRTDPDNPANLPNRPSPKTRHDYWRHAGLV